MAKTVKSGITIYLKTATDEEKELISLAEKSIGTFTPLDYKGISWVVESIAWCDEVGGMKCTIGMIAASGMDDINND